MTRVLTRLTVAVALVIAGTGSAFAEYTTATPLQIEQLPDGTFRLPVRFTGPDVEDRIVAYPVQGSLNAAAFAVAVRRWAIEQAARMNTAKTIAELPAIVNMTPLDLTPPPAVDTTAADARRLWVTRMKAVSLIVQGGPWTGVGAGAINAAITATRTALDNEFNTLSAAEKLVYVRALFGGL